MGMGSVRADHKYNPRMPSDVRNAPRPRPVTVLVAGGTISMTGETPASGASPDLDALPVRRAARKPIEKTFSICATPSCL